MEQVKFNFDGKTVIVTGAGQGIGAAASMAFAEAGANVVLVDISEERIQKVKSDIENLPTEQFAEKVKRALAEGTSGGGRGFVLMPSACPYGRKLSPRTMKNYEKLIEIAERQ